MDCHRAVSVSFDRTGGRTKYGIAGHGRDGERVGRLEVDRRRLREVRGE